MPFLKRFNRFDSICSYKGKKQCFQVLRVLLLMGNDDKIDHAKEYDEFSLKCLAGSYESVGWVYSDHRFSIFYLVSHLYNVLHEHRPYVKGVNSYLSEDTIS